jgi:hypothetical protein
MFHQEIHGIPALAAAKTFKNVSDWIHIEGWRLLIVKRTNSNQVGSAFFKRYEISDYFFNACGLENPVDGLSADHWLLQIVFDWIVFESAA